MQSALTDLPPFHEPCGIDHSFSGDPWTLHPSILYYKSYNIGWLIFYLCVYFPWASYKHSPFLIYLQCVVLWLTHSRWLYWVNKWNKGHPESDDGSGLHWWLVRAGSSLITPRPVFFIFDSSLPSRVRVNYDIKGQCLSMRDSGAGDVWFLLLRLVLLVLNNNLFS